MEILTQFEIPFTLFLQSLGSWLEYPMQAFTFLGNELFFLLVMPAIYWAIDPQIGFRTGMMLILSGGINSFFKFLFHSPRPFWVDERVTAYSSETGFGLPSGHSQNSAAIWGIIAASLKKKWATIVIALLVFFIGISRIYLGVHFLRDVLSGWLIGVLLVVIYMKLETPVSSWLQKKTLIYQVLLGFLLSLLLIGLGLLGQTTSRTFSVPPAWIQTAVSSGADAPDPYNIEGVITIAGVALGFTAGYAWYRARFGTYTVKCASSKRILRYVIGLVGIVVLYFGLKLVFPEEPFLLGMILRYIRYALIGFWVTALAPLAFRALHLDR